MADIFDIYDLDDIPDSIKSEIKRKDNFNIQMAVMQFLKEKKTLSLDEILVALYRKHNFVTKRMNLTHVMAELRQKGMITPGIRKGSYTLNER
jgi:hypothetical protein